MNVRVCWSFTSRATSLSARTSRHDGSPSLLWDASSTCSRHECITWFSVGCVLESVSRFFHYKAFSHEMFQYNYDISDDNRLFHTTVRLREMPSQ